MGKEHSGTFPIGLSGSMNPTTSSVLRVAILVFSILAMVFGILVMAGVLVPRYVPGNFGILFGAVIFLYGLYRFVVAYFRKTER
jgi:hypothetical protein